MYRILAPANSASGPFWKSGQIRLRPEFWPDLAGFGTAVPYVNIFLNIFNNSCTGPCTGIFYLCKQ